MATAKRNLGDGAETHVAHYMASLGYQILAMNYTVPRMGEIDIVARHARNIYFVEVKARSNPDPFGGMEGCISQRKLERIRRCADIYLQHSPVKDAYGKIIGAFVHITPDKKYEHVELLPLD